MPVTPATTASPGRLHCWERSGRAGGAAHRVSPHAPPPQAPPPTSGTAPSSAATAAPAASRCPRAAASRVRPGGGGRIDRGAAGGARGSAPRCGPLPRAPSRAARSPTTLAPSTPTPTPPHPPGEPCCASMMDQRISGLVHNRLFPYQVRSKTFERFDCGRLGGGGGDMQGEGLNRMFPYQVGRAGAPGAVSRGRRVAHGGDVSAWRVSTPWRL
jgi:hypothetical protein